MCLIVIRLNIRPTYMYTNEYYINANKDLKCNTIR